MPTANPNNITLRSEKSSPLTQAEVDQNFQESKNAIDELGRRVVIRENRGDLKSRDNEVGWYIQLSGLTANDDGRGGLYIVKEPNTGTADDETIIALDNGNQAHLVGKVSTGSGVQSVRDALDQRVIYVDTIADLQALPTGGLVDGQVIKVTSTGRSGDFVVRVGDYSTEASEDPKQGVIIQFDDAPTTSVIASRLYNDGEVNAEWWGAKFDGVTNDTSSIMAILDYINTVEVPTTVVFPSGKTGIFDFTGVFTPKVEIRLVGYGCTLKRSDNYNDTSFNEQRMFQISNSTATSTGQNGSRYYPKFTFEGLLLDGNRDNQTQYVGDFSTEQHHGIYASGNNSVEYLSYIVVKNCSLKNFPGDGISVGPNSRVESYDCKFHNCFRGGIAVTGSHFELIVENAHSSDSYDGSLGSYSGLVMELEEAGTMYDGGYMKIDGWVLDQGRFKAEVMGQVEDERHQSGASYEYHIANVYKKQGNRERVEFNGGGFSTITVRDSVFYGGRDFESSMEVKGGGDITFDSCTFYLSNSGFTDEVSTYVGINFGRRLSGLNDDEKSYNRTHGTRTFNKCHIRIDETVPATATTYAIYIDQPQIAVYNLGYAAQIASIRFIGCSAVQQRLVNRSGNVYERVFDYFSYIESGHYGVEWSACTAVANTVFRLQSRSSFPSFYKIDGTYNAINEMFYVNTSHSEPDTWSYYDLKSMQVDERNNFFTLVGSGTPQFRGTRNLTIGWAPGATTPVSVTNEFFHVNTRNLTDIGATVNGKLAGTPVVANSVVIKDDAGVTVAQDDGLGAIIGGSVTSGSIDYSTGYVSIVFSAEINSVWLSVDYSHNNEVPGMEGDIAVLKDSPSTRYICTSTNDSNGTWALL